MLIQIVDENLLEIRIKINFIFIFDSLFFIFYFISYSLFDPFHFIHIHIQINFYLIRQNTALICEYLFEKHSFFVIVLYQII